MVRFNKLRKNREPLSLGLNRARYFVIWVLVGGSAWLYGERMLYVTLAVLTALPIISYLIAMVGIMNLKLVQHLPESIHKEEYGNLTLTIINPLRLPFGSIRCVFYGDDFAVVMQDSLITDLGSFKPIRHVIPFQINYRGQYEVGIKSIQLMDLTGLFRLNRKLNMNANMLALPGIADMTGFPITSNLLTQAQSRYDIRDEDYATISDIRPYLPTDSIKRVHWKLTAKRNEWLVKNFQSKALHQVTLIIDSKRMDFSYKELVIMEDRIIEISLGLADSCMKRGMPVEYAAGEGHTVVGRNPGDFGTVYQTASYLNFEENPTLSPYAILSQCLNDATGYVNAIILTSRLDTPLYERIVNAQNNGHYVAVVYFAPRTTDRDTERIYRLLEEGGKACYRITEGDGLFS